MPRWTLPGDARWPSAKAQNEISEHETYEYKVVSKEGYSVDVGSVQSGDRDTSDKTSRIRICEKNWKICRYKSNNWFFVSTAGYRTAPS